MKIDIQNKPCWIYVFAVMITGLVTGLLMAIGGIIGPGLTMSTTHVLFTLGLFFCLFPTPHKNVRKRNILRIVLLITTFHLVFTISDEGLSGIKKICKTDHPAKVIETCQKTYSTIEIPIVKTAGFFKEIFGKVVQEKTEKQKMLKQKTKTREKATGEKWINPHEGFFSWNYLILVTGILICLYKILFSWSTSAFLLGTLALILAYVYLHHCWNFSAENPIRWRFIWSLITIIPLCATIYLGKDHQVNSATA